MKENSQDKTIREKKQQRSRLIFISIYICLFSQKQE